MSNSDSEPDVLSKFFSRETYYALLASDFIIAFLVAIPFYFIISKFIISKVIFSLYIIQIHTFQVIYYSLIFPVTVTISTTLIHILTQLRERKTPLKYLIKHSLRIKPILEIFKPLYEVYIRIGIKRNPHLLLIFLRLILFIALHYLFLLIIVTMIFLGFFALLNLVEFKNLNTLLTVLISSTIITGFFQYYLARVREINNEQETRFINFISGIISPELSFKNFKTFVEKHNVKSEAYKEVMRVINNISETFPEKIENILKYIHKRCRQAGKIVTFPIPRIYVEDMVLFYILERNVDEDKLKIVYEDFLNEVEKRISNRLKEYKPMIFSILDGYLFNIFIPETFYHNFAYYHSFLSMGKSKKEEFKIKSIQDLILITVFNVMNEMFKIYFGIKDS